MISFTIYPHIKSAVTSEVLSNPQRLKTKQKPVEIVEIVEIVNKIKVLN